MRNESGLSPLGHAVLVVHDDPKKREGLIQVLATTTDREAMVETRATVVEVGPECWLSERSPRAAPGDRVLISRLAGYMAVGPADGRKYRFVNDQDVFARITGENSHD